VGDAEVSLLGEIESLVRYHPRGEKHFARGNLGRNGFLKVPEATLYKRLLLTEHVGAFFFSEGVLYSI